MLSEDDFLEMLADERHSGTGWQDHEVDEFMQAMGENGWVVVDR